VICEQQFLPSILAARELGGKVEHVVCIDGAPDGTIGLADVERHAPPGFDFDAAWRSVRPDDLLTIVYTSGTTGPPKGVELTHANILANARLADDFGGIDQSDTVLSYLPDAHAANRLFVHYQNQLHGIQIATIADMAGVQQALTQVHPTAFLGVPRVWVKLKSGVEATIAEQHPLKRALAEWAIGVGRARARTNSDGSSLTVADKLRYVLADRVVLSKVRAKLGFDNARVLVTGAAAIPRDVHEFILGLGLPVCEGYGMSEFPIAATFNRPSRIKIGTVGPAAPGVTIKIAPDGEVLALGAHAMRGYRKDSEKTSETIDSDGYVHTGDIGVIDADGCLTIVDRKKEIIINAAGKNMSPANIENAVMANCPLVGAVAVIGEQRPYNTALITLDADAASWFAVKHRLADGSVAALAADPVVYAAIETGVGAANAKLSRVEQIKRFTVLPDTWSPGGDFYTPTAKLKRKPIAAAYAEQIQAMYA
jgi:long-chain acyl-CoA synthetase